MATRESLPPLRISKRILKVTLLLLIKIYDPVSVINVVNVRYFIHCLNRIIINLNHCNIQYMKSWQKNNIINNITITIILFNIFHNPFPCKVDNIMLILLGYDLKGLIIQY